MKGQKDIRKSLVSGIEVALSSGSYAQVEEIRENPIFDDLTSFLKRKFGSTYIGRIICSLEGENKDWSIAEIKDIARELGNKISEDPNTLNQIFPPEDPSFSIQDEEAFFLTAEFNRDNNAFFDLEAAVKFGVGVALLNASQNLFPQGYILGVHGREIIGRKMPLLDQTKGITKLPTGDEIKNLAGAWLGVAYHFPSFIKMDVRELEKIVMDYEKWCSGHAGDTFPKMRQGYDIGRQLFGFGLKEKVYASEKPHKILLDGNHLESLTVMDTFDNRVVYKTRSGKKGISVGHMAITEEEFSFSSSIFSPYSHTIGINVDFLQEGFLSALCGAIARDMFVYERGMRFYSTASSNGGGRKKKKNSSIVTWLPRTRIDYVGLPSSIKDAGPDLSSKVCQVASCDVVGHTRKCDNPNDIQLGLAAQHGIDVPEGYTYVRPHKRSSHTTTIKEYRSRSAVEVLFSSGKN